MRKRKWVYFLENFQTVSLVQAKKQALMARTETKFVLAQSLLPAVLAGLEKEYKVLKIKNQSQLPYYTEYFDTADLQMYTAHHNQKLKRYKVRTRKYLVSGEVFAEIKCKNNKNRTVKKRVLQNPETGNLSLASQHFISENTPFRAKNLSPKLSVSYQRVTFLHNQFAERATLDTSLCFSAATQQKNLPDVAIVEIKQARFNSASPLFQSLKKQGIQPFRVSKYCLATVLLNPAVKYNRFKKKLLKIKQISDVI